VLGKAGLWDRLRAEGRIVMGTNVLQTLQFAASGSAEAAFVSLAQVRELPADRRGSSWLPPAADYAAIEQVGVALGTAAAGTPAADFMRWLCRDGAARRAIADAGYDLPR